MKALAPVTLSAWISLAFAAGANAPVVTLAEDSQRMTAATAAAQDTLTLFMEHATGNDLISVPQAMVKVRFPVTHPEMASEIIWVSPFRILSGADFVGILANPPKALTGVTQGDAVEFGLTQIIDWSFTGENGTLYGNYTTRVQLPFLDEEFDGLRTILSEDPVPEAWR